MLDMSKEVCQSAIMTTSRILTLYRKKRCDGLGIPCGNCSRLGLECENRVHLVWEDDVRRIGMKRRGPPGNSKKGRQWQADNGFATSSPDWDSSNSSPAQGESHSDPLAALKGTSIAEVSKPGRHPAQIVRYQQMSAYPRSLDSTESLLLDHYIQTFSREYPTCSGPSNPFLSVFIPLAMKCSMVLDSLLALSGAQRWKDGIGSMNNAMLSLRQRALKATRDLLQTESENHNRLSSFVRSTDEGTNSKVQRPGALLDTKSLSEENLLFILTSSILFLLYEKVSGETTWKPHMEFINQFFECSLQSLAIEARHSPELAEAVRFLHNIFVYNDLVRSTTLQTKPLSSFYLTATKAVWGKCSPLEKTLFPSGDKEKAAFRLRYHYPNLIARLSSGDHSVTEDDIAAWDGSMDWLPSFVLDHNTSDRTKGDQTNNCDAVPNSDSPPDDGAIISELYRTAARIYRQQVLIKVSANGLVHNLLEPRCDPQTLPRLAAYAQSLMVSLPLGSSYENALLWPIGIAAKELTVTQVNARSSILLRLQHLETRFQMRHFQKVQDVLRRYWGQRDIGLDPVALVPEQDAILLG